MCFNTSNVSVEPMTKPKQTYKSFSFNTSNVSVELSNVLSKLLKNGFQYIKCIGWTFSRITKNDKRLVSIHQMYRLNLRLRCCCTCLCLGFNTSNVSVEHYLYFWIRSFFPVSIHQMYRLNSKDVQIFKTDGQFQYIKCIGWTCK